MEFERSKLIGEMREGSSYIKFETSRKLDRQLIEPLVVELDVHECSCFNHRGAVQRLPFSIFGSVK